MIEEMEVLLKHWGEQLQRNGESGGMGSRWQRSWSGRQRASGNARVADHPRSRGWPDGVTQEITAALSELGRQDARGERLQRLAVLRYTDDTPPTWLMQMHLLGFSAGAKQTYYDLVHKLHQRLLQVLTERVEARKWVATGRGDLPQSLLKAASKSRRVG
ncbi:hypothetical protein QNM99_17910 [Pseudomonas sp. PCH446]